MFKWTLCCFLPFSLFGCNSSDDNISQNIPPEIKSYSEISTVRFSESQDVFMDTITEVYAKDIDGSISTYSWEVLSDHELKLTSINGRSFSYSYPVINSENTDVLLIEISVSDNDGAITSQVIEKDLNDVFMAFIYDSEVSANEYVTINANIYGRESKVQSWLWSASADDLILYDIETKAVSFIAPNVSEPTEVELLLEITYSDGEITKSAAKVTVTP